MKYADCVKDTARNPGGSKTLMGMLLNQINGLKLWQTTSSQCNGHHVRLQRPPHSTCDDPLLVSNTSISEAEVVESVKSLKRRKAAGSDGIPPEFWKAICTYNSPACRWAVLLCKQGLD